MAAIAPYVRSRSPMIERRSTSSVYQIAADSAATATTTATSYYEGPYTLTHRAPRRKFRFDHDHLTSKALDHLASVCPLCSVVRNEIVPRVRLLTTIAVD